MPKIISITEAPETQVPEAIASKIFNDMVAFANYSFNKSHAYAYTMISYWCAYMKAYHPSEFYAAHISNSDETQTLLAVEEASKLGIRIIMPSVNHSEATAFTVVTDTSLQAPLTAIKGVGEKAARLIVDARNGLADSKGLYEGEVRETKKGEDKFDPTNVKRAQFSSQKDFLDRIYKRICNSKVQRLLDQTGATPWSEVTEEDMRMARIEYLGHIFKEQIAVDPGEWMDIDVLEIQKLQKVMDEWKLIRQENSMNESVTMSYGSKPRIMMVFEKPHWRDLKKASMGHGDDFEYVRKLLKQQMGMNMKDFYVTSLYKMGKPPLGFDRVEPKAYSLLQREFEAIDPPLVIAFGKGPVEFFAGKGTSMRDMHAKTVMKGATPVICCKSPWSVIMEMSQENIDDFNRVIETLKGIY